MSSTTKLSSCCVLVATCPELVFSCSIVVRRVLETVLDHNNFPIVPSITKGVVLVKLPNKSDAVGSRVLAKPLRFELWGALPIHTLAH